jgi:glycerol-3-phosphate acyltransferase PlsY
MTTVLSLATAYLLGSLPWGLWIGRLRGVDVRRHGSGNLGATNVGRLLGWKLGGLVLVLDGAKGGIAVALARAASGPDTGAFLPAACAAVSVLGHITSPWAGFRGGKGVATAAGSGLVLLPAALLIAAGLFATVFALSRMVSLGSMLAAAALPLAVLVAGERGIERPWHLAWAVTVAILILWRHGSNLGRILAGREPRVGGRGRSHRETDAPETPRGPR